SPPARTAGVAAGSGCPRACRCAPTRVPPAGSCGTATSTGPATGCGPGRSFDWTAKYPGVFMYHCGTPPVMDHMAHGMYGAIVVAPAGGWGGGGAAAQEYVLVQSEFYTQQNADTTYGLDEAKLMEVQPDYVTFNGYANQYRQTPLSAKPGQKIRLFLVNAG